MTSIGSWLRGRTTIRTWIGDHARPSTAAVVIEDRSVSITISRINSTTQVEAYLSAQTVRLDTLSDSAQARMLFGDVGMTQKQRMVLIGYKSTPNVTDTDVQEGDRFVAYNQRFIITKVEATFTDRVLALCEAEY
jgi:hypothetical protein